MRVESTIQIHAVRFGVTVGALIAAPVLLLMGGLLRRRYLLHSYREHGPGLLSKEDGWVSASYFVVTNAVVRWLCWPSERVLVHWDS